MLKLATSNMKAIDLLLQIYVLDKRLKYSCSQLYEYFKFVMLLRIIIIFIHKNNVTYFFDLKFHKVTLPNIAKLKIKIAQ